MDRARVVGSDWTVYQPGRAFWNPTSRRRVATRRTPPTLSVTVRAPVLRLRAPHILVGGYGVYYHALVDFAFQLTMLGDVPGGHALPLLVDDDAPRFVARIADLLGIALERLVPLPRGRVALCDSLTVLPHAFSPWGGLRHPLRVEQARAALLAAAGPPAQPTPTRILVSRTRASMRRVSNQAEVAALCAAFGFTEVVLEDMPMPDQWRHFAGAEVVAAPHGSGLANMVFMRRGTLVMEFIPGLGRCPAYFDNMAAGLGLRHVRLRQQAEQDAPEFAVDLPVLAAALAAALGRG